jgi:hypothetical protein
VNVLHYALQGRNGFLLWCFVKFQVTWKVNRRPIFSSSLDGLILECFPILFALKILNIYYLIDGGQDLRDWRPGGLVEGEAEGARIYRIPIS